jgi:hypothetical protein
VGFPKLANRVEAQERSFAIGMKRKNGSIGVCGGAAIQHNR